MPASQAAPYLGERVAENAAGGWSEGKAFPSFIIKLKIDTVVSDDTVTLLDINNTVPQDIYDEDIKGKHGTYTIKDTFMGFPHHGAVAFGHFGKELYEVFKYIGVAVDEIGYNQPKGVRYPTENPWG